MKKNFGQWLDVCGATVSWLCAIHCILLPFAVAWLPILGLSFLLDETTEQIFIIISLLIATVTLLPGFLRYHGKSSVIFLFLCGFSLIAFSYLVFEEDIVLKIPFLIGGALLMTVAHFVNRRLCRQCAVCRLSA